MNQDQIKKESGLPDISENNHQKKPVVVGIIALTLFCVAGFYVYTKDNKQVKGSIEEVYTAQQEVPIVSNKSESQVGQATTTTPVASSPQVNPGVMQQQLAIIEQKQKELAQRLIAPLMLVSANQAASSVTPNQQPQANIKDPNTQFMNQVSSQGVDVATVASIGPLNTVIAQGSLIHALLETATNSDLPGYLRASVSEPIYSEDGSALLIPRGSRLIGQYKSGMMQGQSRIFVVWTRLITPSGISVQLGSPGVDSLGMAGMGADEINRHFWERFGTASLLSLIGAGAQNIGVNGQDQNNSAAAYREAVASSFAQSADQSLQDDSRISPTLKTYQGKPIMVFVAKDIHFTNVMDQVKPKINVF